MISISKLLSIILDYAQHLKGVINVMWDIISNISSIVTCIAFLLYLAGHIWVVLNNRQVIYEKFTLVPYDSDEAIENEDNILIVDDFGCAFSLESDYGIKSIKIYKVDCDVKPNGKLIVKSRALASKYPNLNKDKLFIKCNLGECIPTTQFEIRRSDFTIVTFYLYESGKNGHILTSDYKFKLTFKGFLYHLCV